MNPGIASPVAAPAIDRRNGNIFILTQLLTYFSAPVLYVGVVQAAFVRVCQEALLRGRKFVNLGVSTVPGTDGDDLNFGLDEFKRRQGGQAELRETYVIHWTGDQT